MVRILRPSKKTPVFVKHKKYALSRMDNENKAIVIPKSCHHHVIRPGLPLIPALGVETYHICQSYIKKLSIALALCLMNGTFLTLPVPCVP